jgi:thymidylate synthase ThyX
MPASSPRRQPVAVPEFSPLPPQFSASALLPAQGEAPTGPQVRLVNAFAQPFNNAIATARTCYSARVITEQDVSATPQARTLRDSIARSTYEAGHHTTLQHATYQFAMEGVSRQFIWSFLHAHPYYNSEQVSQRYVKVRPNAVHTPPMPQAAQQLYTETVALQMATYERLVTLLTPTAAQAYFQVFAGRRKQADRYAGALRKKCQEIARYVLPVATLAHLYHTVSGLTLHRYQRLSNMLDVPTETRAVVQAMVQAAAAHDPLFFDHAEDPLPLSATPEYAALMAHPTADVSSSAQQFVRAFDQELGSRHSVLLDYSSRGEAVLARAVRSVLGLTADRLGDAEAIALVLSPAKNTALGDALNLTSMGKLSRALSHVHYVFAKKLSHTADSQDQRHRTTVGSRPVLRQHYVGGTPDVIVPGLIAQVPEAHDLFMDTVQQTWRAIDTLLDQGVAPEFALYLLPNAFPIRFEQSGDLSGLHHKWTTRLCYNAQEEIWRASLQEVQAVRAVHPHIGQHLLPPCGLRAAAGVRPVCPEGSRFCGVTVWKLSPEDYQRTL